MKDDKVSLFAHPLTFLVTHAVFPLLSALAASYLYWISCDGLTGAPLLKARLFVGAAWLLPLAAVGVLCLRPKRMGAALLFVWAFLGVAFLYLGVPVVGEMMRHVDAWVCGSTPFFSLFAGIVPLVFAGLARIATARWSGFSSGGDLGLSFGLLFGTPFVIFIVVNGLSVVNRHPILSGELAKAIFGHVCAIGFYLGTAAFFIGLLRLIHKLYTAVASSDPDARRILGGVFCGLLLPLAGLALNVRIPFPADFQNVWTWALAVLTGVVLLLPVRASRPGLAAYFLRFLVAPFVLYFFLLFLPFLPLAIPAILAVGAGFLILAPTLLFRTWSHDVYASYRTLRSAFSRRCLLAVAALGFAVLPVGFVTLTEIERADLEKLVAWQTKEEFEELEPPPPPMSLERAKRVMTRVNDYTFGSEIPFLSAWRTFRVYGGMYMADKLRNDLNKRILGRTVEDERDWEAKGRNVFGAGMFGFNSARQSSNRGRTSRWVTRPPRTTEYAASAAFVGTNATDAVFEVTVQAKGAPVESELILDFRVPAGTWVEGMSLKMTNDVWKTARATERKAAEWVYDKITEQRRDPSIVTMDTPTTGRLKVFPVGSKGREVKVRLRRSASLASTWHMGTELIAFSAVPAQKPSTRVFDKKTKRYTLVTPPRLPNQPWQGVLQPFMPVGVTVRMDDIVCDAAAGVSVVSAEWFARHATNAAPSVVGCDTVELNVDDPALMSTLRRRVRFAARHMAEGALGVLPNFRFVKTVDGTNRLETAELPQGTLTDQELAILRRELPGLEVFGDRPVDGWFVFETVKGGKVAVPWRKGENTLVFAALREAIPAGLDWQAGALAWKLDQDAFRHPARDVRKELIAAARRGAALTTQAALIVVETAAQEKGLKQKEIESLHADKAMDFDEQSATSGDAPGFLLLCLGLLAFAAFKRRTALAR